MTRFREGVDDAAAGAGRALGGDAAGDSPVARGGAVARRCLPRRDEPEFCGRLVIAANRLPYGIEEDGGRATLRRAVGGLVSALHPLAERVGATWVGWDGGQTASWARVRRGRRATPYRLAPVALPPRLREPYYDGFCNGTLWPLLHSFLGRAEFRQDWFDAYLAANRAVAARVRRETRPGDVIWVHDYHLLLVPGLLRQAGVSSRIAFFLHIPFPAPDLFRHLPWRAELLAGLAGADAIGLQAPEHVRHLRDAFSWFGPAAGARGGRAAPDIRAVPISIDTRRLAGRARSREVRQRVEAIRASARGRPIVLSVERLDYSKGILERLRAIEHLLEVRRDLRGRVWFLQLSVPTRTGVPTYDRYRREVDEMVGRINGRFSRPEWAPIRYLFRSLPEDELLAYYRAADAVLITSLKDGMNLVAKEYVAARAGAGGVLLLSEFAGAAGELRGALLINPHDARGTAGAVARALDMPALEQRQRMASMYRHLQRHSVHHWVRRCLA
ncbi:MAG: trehalose-6-phosphate synthase [Deltaproteobacteria bacterium]|nr:trehalose-6-phosphate synthase [Deltaproteobacteria bacterium]